ncbi:MAG: hypothetical protein ACI8YQ_003138 [Polaribacter sp.]
MWLLSSRIMTNLYALLFARLKYLLLAIVLLFIGLPLSSAQTVVLSESFNDCEPAPGWSTTIVEGLVDWQFGFIDNSNAWASNSMNGSCFAFFDDEANGGNTLPSVVRLTSPFFDGAAFAEYNLSFDVVFRKQEDLEHFSVFVFDGTTLQLVNKYYDAVGGEQFNNFQTINLDLSPFRTETLQLVFHYDDGGDEGWWVGLDNIAVTGLGVLNDGCDNAVEVALGDNCLPTNNSTAIFTGTAPSCFDRNIGSLWYRFDSPITGIVKMETAANFNDLITVFEGDCAGMTDLACFNRDEHGFTGETAYMNVDFGTSYLIRVSGVDADFGLREGDFCLSIDQVDSFPPTPVNDICNNAISLTVDAIDCTEGSNKNADFTGPEPSLNLKTRSDIWYSFLATASSLEVSTRADFADVISVYSGTCGGLTEVAVNQFGQSLLLENLTIGQTYFVQVGGFFATLEGNVCMQVETPISEVVGNDLCGNALAVTLDGACVEGANQFAAFDGPSPSCEIFPTANVWFEFIAPTSGGVQLNTGTNFPHVVSVYSGTCTNFEEILCMENPLYCSGYFPVIDLVPGETYFLQVAAAQNGFGYVLGDLCLSIVDIASTSLTFDPMVVIIETNCINSGISVLNILTTGGQGSYTVEGDATGDTLVTGADYFTVVTDSVGCEIAISGTVDCGNLPCVLGANLDVVGTSCYNGSDGFAFVDTSNGTGPFSINWNDGNTDELRENLTPGIYFVTVENAAGCSQIFSAAITNPQPIIGNASATGETGQNANDGTATAAPTGGTPPYTYLWSYNNENTQTITGLLAGFYSVVIYDANNCSQIATVSVNSFDCLLTIDIAVEDISCSGAHDGTLTAELMNGTGATYEWSTNATTQTLENLPPGSYSVTITDDNACQNIATATISDPEPTVGLLESTTEVPCFGEATGQAFLDVDGGTAPYTYSWPGGGTGAVQTTLLPGDYVVTFTDANACSGTIPVTIVGPAAPLLASVPVSTDVTCFGETNGTATAFAEGGTASYTYLWDDPMGQSTAMVTNLVPGIYTVTITDNNNCTNTAQATIIAPPILSVSIIDVVGEVGDMSNGAISIDVLGGTPPYTFTWVLGGDIISMEQNISDLESAANYKVLITDANGCMFLSADITVPSLLAVEDIDLAGMVDISPNPTTGKFVVGVDLEEAEEVGVEVFDVLGRLVWRMDLEVVEVRDFEVDLEGEAAGVYVVRVLLGRRVFVGGVVVE